MRTSRTHQPLTYDVRLPDEAQADALRLLDASKAVVNRRWHSCGPISTNLAGERVGLPGNRSANSWESPQYHGDRQWRCESEVVGRILRQQAERKKAFELICPFSLMASFAPKPRSDRQARTVLRSRRPLPSCKRAWKRMRPALSRCKMS